MACRKNAYEAMVKLSEWNEAQREKNQKLEAEENDRLAKLWTPPEIFSACCTPWIQYGPQGCSNPLLCGKDHPKITLWFDETKGGAFARFSHNLDPFVDYFDGLCQQKLATKTQNGLVYHLEGFLAAHVERLERSAPFGRHLVHLAPEAASRSRRAHERFAADEEVRQAAKKRKLLAEKPKPDQDTLVKVLTVCRQHCLGDHLDLVEISWMRVCHKQLLAGHAAKLARVRLENIRLSYSVLLSGTIPISQVAGVGDVETEGKLYFLIHNGMQHVYTVLASRLPLRMEECGRFVPVDPTREFEFYMGRSVLLRVYLEPDEGTTSRLPEQDLLFSNLLEVGRSGRGPYPLDLSEQDLNLLEVGRSERGPYLSGQRGDSRFVCNMRLSGESIHLRLESFAFGFADLMGCYVRKKLPVAKEALQITKRQRPVTAREKNYVRALAKAARESPGNSNDFRGMTGW